MSVFWIIIIIVSILILLFILFFFFIGMAISGLASKGLLNKFGPEWIPAKMGLRFNPLTWNGFDNDEIYTFNLDRQDVEEIDYQLEEISESDLKDDYCWMRMHSDLFLYTNKSIEKIKAEYYPEKRVLVYYKNV